MYVVNQTYCLYKPLLVQRCKDLKFIALSRSPLEESVVRRKSLHGFFFSDFCLLTRLVNCLNVNSKATKGGRRVIARRIAKGRHRVTA